MSSKNPKRVADAFAPVGTQPAHGAVHLGEFTAGTVLVLQQLDHPLLHGRAARKGKTPAPITMDDAQVMQLVFVLAHPPELAFDLLAQGRPAFDRAVIAFAGTLPIGALPELGRKVAEAFARAVSTVLPASAAGAEKKTP